MSERCECGTCPRCKKREYNRTYRARHRERLVEKDRAYYQANRTEKLEYQQRYATEHAEQVAATHARYHAKNAVFLREQALARYYANADHIRAQRRDKRLENGRDPESIAYVHGILKDPCAYCGGPMHEIDHIEPVSRGGTDHWTNLTPACRSCNKRKCDKPLLVFLAHRNGCWESRRDIEPALAA